MNRARRQQPPPRLTSGVSGLRGCRPRSVLCLRRTPSPRNPCLRPTTDQNVAVVSTSGPRICGEFVRTHAGCARYAAVCDVKSAALVKAAVSSIVICIWNPCPVRYLIDRTIPTAPALLSATVRQVTAVVERKVVRKKDCCRFD